MVDKLADVIPIKPKIDRAAIVKRIVELKYERLEYYNAFVDIKKELEGIRMSLAAVDFELSELQKTLNEL